MTQNKIGQLIILLFESKMKSYTTETVKIWVRLLKDYPEKLLIKVIKDIIYSHEDFVSIGMIHDRIVELPEVTQMAQISWDKEKKTYSQYDKIYSDLTGDRKYHIAKYKKNFGRFDEGITADRQLPNMQ